jgi:DUF1680 family protein
MQQMKMKKLFLILSAFSITVCEAQTKDYAVQPVNFTQVKLTDGFWLPRMRINHQNTIPASFERCERTGRVKNFEMAAARSGKFCTIFPFDDTDIYKTLEGASFSLQLFPDKKLDAYMDTLIRKIAAAQEPDGYLYTNRTINPDSPHSWAGKERWEKERELSHELYNSGHLYEAASAHYLATGKKNLLEVALKNADLVCSVFGPGKRHVAPGHEIIEMGLVKLYRITGKKEYLETAKDFIEERGRHKGYDTKSKDPHRNGAYWQDHKPVKEQDEAIGHAVRAAYLYAGVADVAALTGDEELLKAIDRIWENMVSKKFYVQGGLGAVASGERFGDNYELPNSTAYNETCAAIANVYWNHRMFLLHGKSQYIDVLEKSLYNNVISGIGLDGKTFFYSNAMQLKNNFNHRALEHERAGWFDCSCCPTNLARFIPSVSGYMYAQKNDEVFINLFASSNTNLKVKDKKLTILQENNYPWDGALRFTVNPEKQLDFSLKIRIPGWARNEASPLGLYSFVPTSVQPVRIKVNGQAVDLVLRDGYAILKRTWKKNDVVEVDLPMTTREVLASDQVKESLGRVAIQRGPMIYCVEGIDNGGRAAGILLPEQSTFTTNFQPSLLNGVQVIQSQLPVIEVAADGKSVKTMTRNVTAIPYYAWANRGPSEMMIWLPRQVKDIDVLSSLPLSANSKK